jgi:hypothetical protein
MDFRGLGRIYKGTRMSIWQHVIGPQKKKNEIWVFSSKSTPMSIGTSFMTSKKINKEILGFIPRATGQL